MKIQRNGANLIVWDSDGSRRYAVAAPGGDVSLIPFFYGQ